MHTERLNPVDISGAEIARAGDTQEQVSITGSYEVKCFDADGNLKWEDNFKNIVVNAGKIDLLTQYFKGSAYTAAFYLGLVDNAGFTTYAPSDTMSSHGGWTESAAYDGSNRPSISFGTATASGGSSNPGVAGTGSISNTTAVTFTINATATILGAFLTTGSAKSGTTGTLYSAGSFTGGSRSVVASDSLLVTYTAQD
jgi:hypothetical protein